MAGQLRTTLVLLIFVAVLLGISIYSFPAVPTEYVRPPLPIQAEISKQTEVNMLLSGFASLALMVIGFFLVRLIQRIDAGQISAQRLQNEIAKLVVWRDEYEKHQIITITRIETKVEALYSRCLQVGALIHKDKEGGP